MNTLFGSQWQPWPAFLSLSPSERWEYLWLPHTGSLTQALKKVCQHQLRVNVLTHRFIDTPLNAQQDLQTRAGEQVLHREVLLCDRDIPLIFACSLLPEVALTGRFQELRQLGERPLGHWIFSEPVLKRQQMTYIRLAATDGLFKHLPDLSPAGPDIYGRKTLFSGADKPFLVSEFFLPDLANYTPR